MSKYPSTSLPQTMTPEQVQKAVLDLLAKINETAAATQTASDSMVPWTNEVLYTPTFTGFGTVTVHNFSWLRMGNRIKVMGRFQSGTPTGVEARISLPNNLVSDSSLLSAIAVCGVQIADRVGAVSNYCLIEPGVGYITDGSQQAGTAALTKRLGNAVALVGDIISVQFELPVSGWNG